MARIPEETIEEIRSKTDIVDLISEYVQLTKKGKDYLGLCPFHNENTPSFSVSADKQLFYCFGCGTGGNVITFIRDLENRTFIDAAAFLASRIGMDIGNYTNHPDQNVTQNPNVQRMKEAHTLAASFYNHILLNTVEGEMALNYLQDRGFTREIIQEYEIGWALDNYDSLTSLLKRDGYNMQEMEKAGLVLMKNDGTDYFDRFRGRIMFPLWDDNGHIVAFSGRSISTDGQEAKYLNSPETLIFEKSQILYNFHKARLNIRKTGKVILFEGFLDVLAASRENVQNTVAIMGTALSEKHLLKLKRVARELIICCDGDDAGWEAAKRFSSLAQTVGLNAQVALLPSGMDPDDYIRSNGGDAFKSKIINQPHPHMSFIMAYAKRNKNLSFHNDVLQYIQEVLEELANNTSPIEKDLYVRQLSEETKVSEEAIQQQLIKIIGNQARQAKKNPVALVETKENLPITSAKRERTGVERAQKILLHYLLNDGSFFDRFYEEEQDLFVHEDYAAIFVRLAGFYEQYKTPNYQRFSETIEEPHLRQIVLEAAMFESNPDIMSEEIEDCIQYLNKYRIKLQIDEKQHELKEAERNNDYELVTQLSLETIALRRSLFAL